MHEGNAPLYYRFGMSDTANAMLSVVGCLAALYHQRAHRRGPGAVDVAARRRRDVRVRRACSSTASRCRGPQLDKGQHGIDACYRLYETQDGWIQIAAVKDARVGRAVRARSASPELADDARFATADRAAEHRTQLETLLEPRFAHADARVLDRARSTTPACRTRSRSTRTAASSCCSTPTTTRSGSSPSTSTRLLGHMRQFGSSSTSRRRPGHIHGPPPLVGQHTREILEWLGFAEATTSSEASVVYWPDDTTAGPV